MKAVQVLLVLNIKNVKLHWEPASICPDKHKPLMVGMFLKIIDIL